MGTFSDVYVAAFTKYVETTSYGVSVSHEKALICAMDATNAECNITEDVTRRIMDEVIRPITALIRTMIGDYTEGVSEDVSEVSSEENYTRSCPSCVNYGRDEMCHIDETTKDTPLARVCSEYEKSTPERICANCVHFKKGNCYFDKGWPRGVFDREVCEKFSAK